MSLNPGPGEKIIKRTWNDPSGKWEEPIRDLRTSLKKFNIRSRLVKRGTEYELQICGMYWQIKLAMTVLDQVLKDLNWW